MRDCSVIRSWNASKVIRQGGRESKIVEEDAFVRWPGAMSRK